MTTYLKIENPGVAPAEAFTLLGASTKRNASSNVIGMFGSGNKHGVSVLLRHGLGPTIFAGNLRMEFGTRKQEMGEHEFARVVVKYGGKDSRGSSRSSVEDLGFVLEYGATDWLSIDLALREFVSNAIDRTVEEEEKEFLANCSYDEITASYDEIENFRPRFDRVVIEVVNDSQVRAKAGHTRVFVPMNTDVFRFYDNLGKWFLHFSEPELLNKTILPKANRNLSDRKAAVIYRRGVRVREFESSNTPSLFDYNLENLQLDESRKVDDWRVQAEAARAISDADEASLRILVNSFIGNAHYWEHDFQSYHLDVGYGISNERFDSRKKAWKAAFEAIAGPQAVLATKDAVEFASRKGFKVVKAPEPYVIAAGLYSVPTPNTMLTNDEREGREIYEPTDDAQEAVDFVWGLLEAHGVTNGRKKPPVKTFRKIMEAGSQTLGYYRDGVVYLNQDICEGRSQQLLVTALEEVVHHVTGATDNSRDFQDFALNLAIYLARSSG